MPSKKTVEKKIRAERYTYRIEWSEDDGCHVARCLEFRLMEHMGNN